MSAPRSNRASVRNPLVALPSFQALQAQPAEVRRILHRLLLDLAGDANARAQHSWKQRKAPMAAYWKVVSVYARHIARAFR